jgi:hypothetical protein
VFCENTRKPAFIMALRFSSLSRKKLSFILRPPKTSLKVHLTASLNTIIPFLTVFEKPPAGKIFLPLPDVVC